jgi:NADH-quinone oxidoreductase subunit J
MQHLHLFLIFLLILSSFFVFLSDNPVHSVLFLILTFCNASSILILFNAEFLGLLFIIIYVGAIAVLFLFVVMMLNVKIYSFQNLSMLPFLCIGSLLVISQFFFKLKEIFFNLTFENDITFFSYEKFIDNLGNIDVFGQALYNYYLVCFLLAGLILLVAMIGAIILTLNFKSKRKNELVFRQLSRSDNFISFFK